MQPSEQDPRRILLLITGDLADVIQRTPHVKAVRQRFPAARIAALVNERGAPALRNCPYLDELIVRKLPYQGEFRLAHLRSKLVDVATVGRRLWKQYDLVLSLMGPLGSGPLWHVLAFLSRAPRRIGHESYHTGWLLTHNLGPGTSERSNSVQVAQALAVAGVVEPAADPYFEIWPTDTDATSVETLLREHDIADAKLVAICPGSDWSCQQWAFESWAAVADALVKRYGLRVVVVGTAGEHRLAEGLARSMRAQPIDLTGRTTLGELAILLRRCRLALTLESAPCAVALAVGTPTVALFASTPVWIGDEHRGPVVPLRKYDDTAPTWFTRCKRAKMALGGHHCESDACIGGDGTRSIAPIDVLIAARSLLDNDSPVSPGPFPGSTPVRVLS